MRSPLSRRAFLGGAVGTSAALLAGRARAAPTLDGTWRLAVGKLDNGDDLTIHYELKQSGRRLTGRAIHIAAYGYAPIENGRVDGDRFSFDEAYFKVRGALRGDELHIEADYDRLWPYTNALNPEMIKVPFDWKGRLRPFVAHRVPDGAGLYPAGAALPALRDLPGNGLAQTPPMIWGAWYSFTTTITDELIRDMAQAMVSTGLRDAGYDILNMEVGWTGRRDAQGNLQANAKFPSMKGLGDHLHALGLKMGICTSPGPYDCIGYAGSLNHEDRDAKTFAGWGVDFIKHDACSVREVYPNQSRLVYQKMGEALQACGRPIVYSLCQYGENDVWEWGARVGGNMWRTTGDIEDSWESISGAFDQSRLAAWAGPGHWNDPDYLMAGLGGMSTEEYRTQMSLWCMLAAPLIVSADLRRMSADVRSILLNRHLIAVDQDRRGIQGQRVAKSGDRETWVKPLQDGHAIALFNRGQAPATIAFDLARLGLPPAQEAHDLWEDRTITLEDGGHAARVAAHGAAVFRVGTESS